MRHSSSVWSVEFSPRYWGRMRHPSLHIYASGSLMAHDTLFHLSTRQERVSKLALLKNSRVRPRGIVTELTLYCSLVFGDYVWGICDRGHIANMRLSVLLTLTVPKVVTLGEKVAPFSLPPEARPTDPVRREVFRQQAAGHHSSWFALSAVPLEAPQDLVPSLQESAGLLPVHKRCRRH